MKTTIKYLMLAFVAVLACASITSCGNDDDDDQNKGISNYYLQLSSVETNCIDADGNNLADLFKSGWISANQADAQGKIIIGKTDNQTAIALFDEYINELVQAFNDEFYEKNLLPDDGYILYTFYLGSDASYGGATGYVRIKVTNSGAKIL